MIDFRYYEILQRFYYEPFTRFDFSWRIRGYKTILAYDIPALMEIKDGVSVFDDLDCPVKRCRLTSDHTERPYADLVLFQNNYVHTYGTRSPDQIYALYYMVTVFATIANIYFRKTIKPYFFIL